MADKKKHAKSIEKAAQTGRFQKPKDTKKTIKRLLKYLTARKLPLVVVFVCMIWSSLAGILGVNMLRPIIRRVRKIMSS